VKTLWRNVWWGAGWGLFTGVIYSAFGMGVLLLRGGGSSARDEVSAPVLILFYLLAGLVGGVIVGLFRPLLKHRAWSTATGVIALLPASVGVLRLMAGPISGWGGAEWFAVFGTAAFLGGYFGYNYWDLQHFDPLGPLPSAQIGGTKPRPKGRPQSRKQRSQEPKK